MKEIELSKRLLFNAFFALGVILISLTSYFSYKQLKALSASHGWITHTYKVIDLTDDIFLNVLRAESTARGYIITNNQVLINDYNEIIIKSVESLKLAKELTRDNPNQKKLFEKLDALLNERIMLLQKLLDSKKSKKIDLTFEASTPIVIRGQQLTTNIQELTKKITDNEIALLQEREKSFLYNYNTTNTVLDVANITYIILLLFIIIYFNKLLSELIIFQKSAAKSESLLRGIVQGSKEYIAALDLNYNFVVFNEAFQKEFYRLFGKHISIGTNLKTVLEHLPAEQKKAVDIWERALSGEEYTIIEEFGGDEHSRSHFEITYSSINDEKNRLIGATVIARNIEKRLRAENKLKDMNTQLETSFHQLKKQSEEMSIINEMSNTLRSSASMDETLSIARLFLRKLFQVCSGAIYIMDSSKQHLELAIEWNGEKASETFLPDECWALRKGEIYFFIDKDESIPCIHEKKSNHPYLCVPLMALNEVLGTLFLKINPTTHASQKEEALDFYEQNKLMIRNIAGQIALSISSIRLYEKMKQTSTHDVLTGLYNRTYLEDYFEKDLQLAKRRHAVLAVVMMDLDYFKSLNDKYGHKAGDIILQKISKLILSHLRQSDIVCRYGGEEILMILHDTALEEATNKISELKQKISELQFLFDGDVVTITSSFGISMFPKDGENSNQLIKAADEALYMSKNTGRNKITIYNT